MDLTDCDSWLRAAVLWKQDTGFIIQGKGYINTQYKTRHEKGQG